MDIKCQYCEAELEADENCYGEICYCPICEEKINIPFPDDLSDNVPENVVGKLSVDVPDNETGNETDKADPWGPAPF